MTGAPRPGRRVTDDVDPLDELATPEELLGKDELDEGDEMELAGADVAGEEPDGAP